MRIGTSARIGVVGGLLVAAVLAGNAESQGSLVDSRATRTPCAVTLPNGRKPPGSASAAMPPVPPAFHGNGKLWVKLWPLGVIVAKPNVVGADGSIGIKLPWWRAVPGTLIIRATRLDARASTVRGDVPSGYGPRGFQASGIDFPTEGCWRVTGRVGTTSLTFVSLVVDASGNGY